MKERLTKMIATIRGRLCKCKAKRPLKKKKPIFWSLTPKDDLDLQIYEQAIDYAFKKKDIHNVAISGAYGAGKSSILASYKKRHRRLKFMHISLAHYQPIANQDSNIKENALELKILNQLVHQIPANKIPQTGFRVKRPITFWRTLLWTVSIAGFSMALLYVFLFAKWVNFANALSKSVSDSWSPYIIVTTQHYARFLALGLCVLFALLILYKIIRVQRLKSVLKKVSIQGNEIELTNGEVDSFFDRYLNEVRYLFENVGVNAIVFEDMDRFNMESIFERLHEVNTLVNLCRKRKPLRFIYLLRDDIYKTKDRTKFFDFIIPVIPVIDGSNSYNKLKEMLEKAELASEFDDSFLQGISLYIDDMRLLQNIVNEFTVYYHELGSTEPNANNMMAIITYKNLFPKDFSELQLGRGYVAALFASKHKLISTRQEELTAEIEKAETRITEIKAEIAKSEREIDLIYSAGYYSYNRPTTEIATRKQLVREKNAGYADELRENIVSWKKTLAELTQSKLCELLDRENTDGFMIQSEHAKEFRDVLSNDYFALLKYLIRNGFIGEMYSDYMTYFYDGSISVADKTFLRSITDQEAKDYIHPLRSVAVVLSRMRDTDFDQVESLNFDLFAYMLQQNDTNLSRFIAMMQKEAKSDFVVQYFEQKRNIPELIVHLAKSWFEFTYQAIANGWFDKQLLKEYTVNALTILDAETLQTVNKDNCLARYASELPDYLHIDSPNVNKLIKAFDAIDIRFESIEETSANSDLLKVVCANNLYVLNAHNISVMLHTQYHIHDDETIKHQNYTAIMSRSDSPLAVYVQENIEDYMRIYLEMCDGKTTDSEASVIAIANDTSISLDAKKEYLGTTTTMIADIKKVTCVDCWDTILEKSVAAFSTHNILSVYFQQDTLSSLLVRYMNNMQSAVNRETIKDECQIDDCVKLMEAIMQDNTVLDDKFEQWIVALHSLCADQYDSFKVGTALNDKKMRLLFDNNIIPLTTENLSFVRTNYPKHIRYFVSKRISEYVTIMNKAIFDYDEMLAVLSWREVGDDDKLKLLAHSSKPIGIIESSYSDPIKLYILQHNFDSNELAQCLKDYAGFSAKLQSAIIDLALLHFDEVLTIAQQLDGQIICKLLSSKITIEQKVALLVKMIGTWEREEILGELDKCGLGEYRQLLTPRLKKTVPVNSISSNLLEAFQSVKWIEAYAKDSGDNSLYRVDLKKKSK